MNEPCSLNPDVNASGHSQKASRLSNKLYGYTLADFVCVRNASKRVLIFVAVLTDGWVLTRWPQLFFEALPKIIASSKASSMRSTNSSQYQQQCWYWKTTISRWAISFFDNKTDNIKITRIVLHNFQTALRSYHYAIVCLNVRIVRNYPPPSSPIPKVHTNEYVGCNCRRRLVDFHPFFFLWNSRPSGIGKPKKPTNHQQQLQYYFK